MGVECRMLQAAHSRGCLWYANCMPLWIFRWEGAGHLRKLCLLRLYWLLEGLRI